MMSSCLVVLVGEVKIGTSSAKPIEVERPDLSIFFFFLVSMLVSMLIRIPCQSILCSTAGNPLGGSSGRSRGFGKPFWKRR